MFVMLKCRPATGEPRRAIQGPAAARRGGGRREEREGEEERKANKAEILV